MEYLDRMSLHLFPRLPGSENASLFRAMIIPSMSKVMKGVQARRRPARLSRTASSPSRYPIIALVIFAMANRFVTSHGHDLDQSRIPVRFELRVNDVVEHRRRDLDSTADASTVVLERSFQILGPIPSIEVISEFEIKFRDNKRDSEVDTLVGQDYDKILYLQPDNEYYLIWIDYMDINQEPSDNENEYTLSLISEEMARERLLFYTSSKVVEKAGGQKVFTFSVPSMHDTDNEHLPVVSDGEHIHSQKNRDDSGSSRNGFWAFKLF